MIGLKLWVLKISVKKNQQNKLFVLFVFAASPEPTVILISPLFPFFEKGGEGRG